mmetsp:Transcript_40436/g.128810  ORF Transcript_40436/g.128810 Transcript_40436/m.128810 type:complete len:314 (+) Transcript_40436:180-1121(+)
MDAGGGRSSACRCRAADVFNPLGLAPPQLPHRGVEARPHVLPRPHVLGLLLHPHKLTVCVPCELVEDDVIRERRDLLHAEEHHVVKLLLPAQEAEAVVDLARAEDHPPHLRLRLHEATAALALREVPGVVGTRPPVPQHPEEVGAGGEVFQSAGAGAVVEEVLGREEHQGLGERPVNLPAERVEVIGWSGDIENEHVGVLLGIPPVERRHEVHPPLPADRPLLQMRLVEDGVDVLLLAGLIFIQNLLHQRLHLLAGEPPRPILVRGVEGREDLPPRHRRGSREVVRIIIDHLKKSLHPRRAVIRPLPVVPVRQ